MVVDDERAIRMLVARVLQREGHHVIACGGAEDALAENTPIDLLIVDHVLAGMNGRQLSEAMRKRYPTLPVILMSGYLGERDLMPGAPSSFLQKPMLPSAVVDAVNKLLVPPASPAPPVTSR
jgi:DNA-binding NtrC family response regulator